MIPSLESVKTIAEIFGIIEGQNILKKILPDKTGIRSALGIRTWQRPVIEHHAVGIKLKGPEQRLMCED
jgi:hypothetical protein